VLVNIGSKTEDMEGKLAELLRRLEAVEGKIEQEQEDTEPGRSVGSARAGNS
jgi:hypothetical protein